MSDWLELEEKLRKLRDGIGEKPIEHTLEMLILYVHRIATQMDMDLLQSGSSRVQASLDEVSKASANARLEAVERDMEWTSRDISRRMEKHFADLNQRLDAIEQRLLRGYDE